MSTPKPGQIRCPTCLRSTPPAAFCTQCGSAIPQSARARPRGLDRNELEERVRRRPGENAFRRGGSADEGGSGYAPFQPEPEDALAVRGDPGEQHRNLDNLPPDPDPDLTRPIDQPVSREWARSAPPDEPAVDEPAAAGPAADADDGAPHEPTTEPPLAVPPPVMPAPAEPDLPASRPVEPYDAGPTSVASDAVDEQPAPYPPEAYEDVEYGRPEDAYAYAYETAEDRRGGSALPIIGFVVLCVLALAVGAVLAGLLGDDEPVGGASPTPSAPASQAASVAPSVEPSAASSETGSQPTPQPDDGPVTFPDGAMLSIQPCGSSGFQDNAVGRPEEDACQVDGSSISDGEVWAFVVFNGASGSDALTVRLLSNDQVENEQQLTIDAVLGGCGDSCNGLIYGAHYVDLIPGDYELELLRDGEFADSATFTVEG